jgi:hypothetical protein
MASCAGASISAGAERNNGHAVEIVQAASIDAPVEWG